MEVGEEAYSARATYAYRLYQGGIAPRSRIRVVKIGDWDVEACGDTHVRFTGEIGIIEILRTERIQDGVERLLFSSGLLTVDSVQRIEGQLHKIARSLAVPFHAVSRAVDEYRIELKMRAREVQRFKDEHSEYEAGKLLSHAKEIDGLLLMIRVMNNVDVDTLMKRSSILVEEELKVVVLMGRVDKTVRIVVMAGEFVVMQGVHSGIIAAKISPILGGGSGGTLIFGQGGGANIVKVDDALMRVEATLREPLGRESVGP